MNCVNHPETPVTSYCQSCGKGLCAACTRPVAGLIYCEECLAAKVGASGSGSTVFPPGTPLAAPGPNPALATVLGIIPGVGAMYNGQFVKAMIHVLVFVILIAITNEHDFFGFFIAAWVIYQIFDANQTAKARRDGLPLPDPFGLNDLAARIGGQYAPTQTYTAPPVNPASTSVPPPYPPPAYPAASSFVGGAPFAPYPPAGSPYAPSPPPNVTYPPPPYPDIPPPPPPTNLQEAARRNEPIGAIVLIALGLVFLFGTLGIFRFDWIGRGWPVILIVIGVWLFYKRARETNPPPGGGL